MCEKYKVEKVTLDLKVGGYPQSQRICVCLLCKTYPGMEIVHLV